ncbi:MAG: homoserine kinase [Dehalococcoidia bacterium]|nr:MAG: homoserine kinase [Dehalococcoidia bacterium]
MARSVTVRVPATSANLGPGFDALGVALDWAGEITLSEVPSPVEPAGSMERLALMAATALFAQAGEPMPPLAAEYRGDMPIGRGLGMSAAAFAGGVVAANEFVTRAAIEDLIPLAFKLEGHGDNIIPTLLGGFCVVADDDDGPVWCRIEPPADLRLALFVPDFDMPTHESRERLPKSLTRGQAVHNIARAALVVAAITQHRYNLLGTATQDILHQPARATLFPAMLPALEAARKAGAHGAYLSGGGSTLAAFVTDRAESVAGAMREAAAAHGISGVTRVVSLSPRGTEVVTTVGAR